MPVTPDRPVTPGTDPATKRPAPDREMDQDRADDIRPSDGVPTAGAGFDAPVPDPVADEGERGPGR